MAVNTIHATMLGATLLGAKRRIAYFSVSLMRLLYAPILWAVGLPLKEAHAFSGEIEKLQRRSIDESCRTLALLRDEVEGASDEFAEASVAAAKDIIALVDRVYDAVELAKECGC